MSEDLFNVFPRRRAIISLKSKIGKNGSARVAPGSMSTEEKELLENEGLTKTLPKGEIILARARYFS